MAWFFAGLVLLAVVWVRRRRRKVTLAGLNSAKPQYMLPPPTRSMVNRKEHHW